VESHIARLLSASSSPSMLKRLAVAVWNFEEAARFSAAEMICRLSDSHC
jgi:hypothetical protein